MIGKRGIKTTLAALACAVAGTGVAAQGYDCTMTTRDGRGFVMERMIFIINKSAQTALVFDAIIQEVHGEAIPADVRKIGETAWRLKWRVDGIPTRQSGGVAARYSARLDLAKQTVDLSGLLLTNMQEADGRGTCRIVNN